jgi:hypothetical protein
VLTYGQILADHLNAVGGPEALSPGFVVGTAAGLRQFAINEAAFDRWVAAKGDELEFEIPNRRDDSPGGRVADLFYEALQGAVVDGDPRIEVNVYGDDDWETSGYHVVVRNRSGDQCRVGITAGWTELPWVDKLDLSPRDQARAYLQDICGVANEVIHAGCPMLQSTPPAGRLKLDDLVGVSQLIPEVIGRALTPDESSRLKSAYQSTQTKQGDTTLQRMTRALRSTSERTAAIPEDDG